MQLVIAEKPSVGVALAKALGVTDKKDGYIGATDISCLGVWDILFPLPMPILTLPSPSRTVTDTVSFK